ncbi:MAG: DUF6483 family protein [Tissierellia bacterium]|nr:DUF6483 family protein [Tissierellia bacterium]
MYHQDWVMRQIELMVGFIVKIIFKKDNMEFNIYDESNSTKIHILYERLISLINQNKFDEAENILFEKANINDSVYLKIAIDFYNKINKLSDEDLQKGNFTREEIKLGIEDILRLYNISLPL